MRVGGVKKSAVSAAKAVKELQKQGYDAWKVPTRKGFVVYAYDR